MVQMQLESPVLIEVTPAGELWRLTGYAKGNSFHEQYMITFMDKRIPPTAHGDPDKLRTFYHNSARNYMTRRMIEHIFKE